MPRSASAPVFFRCAQEMPRPTQATASPASTPETSGPSHRLTPNSTATNRAVTTSSPSHAVILRMPACHKASDARQRNTGALISAEWLPRVCAGKCASRAPITVARPSVPHGMMTMPARAIFIPDWRVKSPISSGTVAISETPKPVIASSSGARPSTMKITCAGGVQPSSLTHAPMACGAPPRSTRMTKASPGTITHAVLRNRIVVS